MLHLSLRRTVVTLAGMLGAAIIGAWWALPFLGGALVTEQRVPRADAILMLAAGPLPWSRLLETAAQARRYPDSVVLLTQTQAALPAPGNPHGDLPFQEQTRRALVRLGVPAHRLLPMSGVATSTVSELCLLRAQVARRGFRAVLLVTDRAHSARTLAVARAVLSEGLAVGIAPSRFDSFEADTWWWLTEQREVVIVESAKWLHFWRQRLRAQWSRLFGRGNGTPQDRLCGAAAHG